MFKCFIVLVIISNVLTEPLLPLPPLPPLPGFSALPGFPAPLGYPAPPGFSTLPGFSAYPGLPRFPPFSPMPEPSISGKLIEAANHAKDVADTGIQQQKLATDALAKAGHLMTGIQQQEFITIGAQAKDITDAAIKQKSLIEKVLTKQKEAIEQNQLGAGPGILQGQQNISVFPPQPPSTLTGKLVEAATDAKEVVDTGIKQQKLASDAITKAGHLMSDTQKQEFLTIAAQAKTLTNNAIKQETLIANLLKEEGKEALDLEQKQLGTGVLHGQQIMSAGTNAQNLVFDSIQKQFLNGVELEKLSNSQSGAVGQGLTPQIHTWTNGVGTGVSAVSPWSSYYSYST